MFAQSDDQIRDFIFPLLLVEADGLNLRYRGLLGTGFFVGAAGIAITAGHVGQNVLDLAASTSDPRRGVAGAFVTETGGWWSIQAVGAEIHPTEDIAVLQMDFEQQTWKPSFMRMAGTVENASCSYQQWAYPEDVLYDIVEGGQSQERPDLVYIEGYIRRRMTGISLPAIQGQNFYELSTSAGPGASGSPIILKHRRTASWNVIGVYVGERLGDGGVQVGYAAREEDFRDWTPQLLKGRSLFEIAPPG